MATQVSVLRELEMITSLNDMQREELYAFLYSRDVCYFLLSQMDLARAQLQVL